MIYDKLHLIPARLYFEILENNNLSLLNPKGLELDLDALEIIWNKLQEQDLKISENTKTLHFVDVSKRIESLKCRQKKVELAVKYLAIIDDKEVREVLTSMNYKFTDDLKKDLDRITRLNKDLDIQIGKLKNSLPKEDEKGKQPTFDELVMAYNMIGGVTVRANDITQAEFRSLEKNVKLKAEQSGE